MKDIKKPVSARKKRQKPDQRIEAVNIPIELYQSERGRYFVGYADELTFGLGKSTWARLYNPPNSRVNLHVNVWTVTDVAEVPFRAQFWFNSKPRGKPIQSDLVTPANTAFRPLPKPKIKLQFATDVEGEPIGGIKAFVRRAQPEATLVDVENGKFIFKEGGSFLVNVSAPEAPNIAASGRVAFGWWEEPVKRTKYS
ncbi:DUF6143 family protein [Salipaludibacillus aurantiacus]|uniref:Uncharacterized protein n=1 Tax=Salipaludibacillus aurantiacus TaxID=1601833 RepID=A0A1H9VXC6_9BACI|nr:DUF6143 family protein [Salipaludibacillus aurantiacus]SES25943.1 hypothetical protein SAMN05518684_1137 [Salipaludibacillus aurantiacus]